MNDLIKYAATICSAYIVSAQGIAANFKNLGFDDADASKLFLKYSLPLEAGFYGAGFISDLLPGWTLKGSAGNTATAINFNESALGPGSATLWESRNFPHPAFEASGYYLELDPSVQIRLSQIADTPAGLNGLLVTRTGIVSSGGIFEPLTVAMNGEVLKLLAVFDNRQFVYDVSAFTGKTVELELIATRRDGIFGGGTVLIDSMVFIVPEPSASVLMLTAGVLLLGGCRVGRCCR